MVSCGSRAAPAMTEIGPTMTMLDPGTHATVHFPASQAPLLTVVVDTEEEFDWSRPLSRDNTAVASIRHQVRAHRVFERYGIRPTYVVDYPVATQEAGIGPLRELLDDGLCAIGAHLHPWVNPPHEETVSARNSYPGNLPGRLEHEKLRRLSGAIEEHFGARPTIYKAGRYGVGPSTSAILAKLGFEIDTSVVPGTSFGADGGPDFGRLAARPYWFGPDAGLLEVPLTVGFAGALRGYARTLFPMAASPGGVRLRLPGLLARLGLLERMKLTPEGVPGSEHRRITRILFDSGHRVFCFCYHSPSLDPGNTPYVRTPDDLDRFINAMDRYFDFFVNDMGGRFATLGEIRDLALTITGAPGEIPDRKINEIYNVSRGSKG